MWAGLVPSGGSGEKHFLTFSTIWSPPLSLALGPLSVRNLPPPSHPYLTSCSLSPYKDPLWCHSLGDQPLVRWQGIRLDHFHPRRSGDLSPGQALTLNVGLPVLLTVMLSQAPSILGRAGCLTDFCHCCSKYYKPSGLKQLKSPHSQFWKLNVQNQGVCRATLPLKPGGKDPSCLSHFWQPWTFPISQSLCGLLLWSLHMVFPLCMSSVSKCPSFL